MADFVWMADQYAKARILQSAVDWWKPQGWAESDEPSGGDFVWMQHEVHKGRAKFPHAAVESWQLLGWRPSDPPQPYDVTKDPQLVDVPETPAEPPAKPARRSEQVSENKP